VFLRIAYWYLAEEFYLIVLLYMQGMGEPLNNYTALVEAIQVLIGSPFQLSPKRITVSTVSITAQVPHFACGIIVLEMAVGRLSCVCI
jgi:adenine C2-methylase RlmN of 23S rRNA A2503 and tRNA A37